MQEGRYKASFTGPFNCAARPAAASEVALQRGEWPVHPLLHAEGTIVRVILLVDVGTERQHGALGPKEVAKAGPAISADPRAMDQQDGLRRQFPPTE